MLLVVSPIVYEAGLIVVSNWQAMTGVYWEPHTPALDALREGVESVSRSVVARSMHHAQSGRMSPSVAIPLGIGWSVALMLVFLRLHRLAPD